MNARQRGASFRSRAGDGVIHLTVGVLLLLGAGSSHAQPWELQVPWPTSHDLHGLSLLDSDEAWIVGSGMLADGTGSVLHTIDGGMTWEKTVLATSQINAIFFLDSQHGWIVGNDTFRTTDGGQSWSHVNSWGTLEDVFFIDLQRGWGCGNGAVVYRTTDGGVSWSTVGPIGGWTLREIFFVTPLEGWTADIGGSIYHSTDGGAHWTSQFSDPNAWNLGSVQFFDAQEGWVIGGDHFYHTSSGGATWQRKTVPPGTWAHNARFAPDRLVGVAVGEFGNVVRTTNGGATWATVSPAEGRPRLERVRMWDSLRGFYVGDAAMIYATTDGGASWMQRGNGGWAMTHAIDALDGERAWAACEGGEVLRTVNGGLHWERVFTPGIDAYGKVNDVSFVDAAAGYAVGEHVEFGYNDFRVLGSTDGGASWQTRAVFTNILGLDRVETVAPNTLFVAGDMSGATVARSTDGGSQWTDVSPGPYDVSNLDFVTALVGWVVGDRIHKTTDGGGSWIQQGAPAGFLIDLSMADAQHGWAVGGGGTVLHTVNGGTSWVSQDPGTTESLFAVSAVSSDEAWAAVLTGNVIHTTDGGSSWSEEIVADDGLTNFEAIAFPATGAGWVGGNTGIWHRRGITAAPPAPGDASKATARVFLAAAPNPFDRGTVVRFVTRHDDSIRLEIFDASGRCIREMLHGDAAAGEHRIEWDGRDRGGRSVPSGVYYLSLEGNSGATRRQIVRMR